MKQRLFEDELISFFFEFSDGTVEGPTIMSFMDWDDFVCNVANRGWTYVGVYNLSWLEMEGMANPETEDLAYLWNQSNEYWEW